MKIKFCFIALLLTTFSSMTLAEKVRVGLEPFPPLITQDEGGYSVDLLRAVEKISDLQFDIIIMTYSRARRQLRRSGLDLIGHTPYQNETKEFYQTGQELTWSIVTHLDLFTTHPRNLSPAKFKQLNLGTPFGNKEFMMELTGLPDNQFTEGFLENLLRMMQRDRIDGILFERASTMSNVRKLQLSNIHYRKVQTLPASFAVRKTAEGHRLKKKLDDLFKQIDQSQIFASYFEFLRLPPTGIVPLQ